MKLGKEFFSREHLLDGIKESYFSQSQFEDSYEDVCTLYFLLSSLRFIITPEEVVEKVNELCPSLIDLRKNIGLNEAIKVLRSFEVVTGHSRFSNIERDRELLWDLLKTKASLGSPIIMFISGRYISVVNVHMDEVYFMDPTFEHMLFSSCPREEFLSICFRSGGFVETVSVLSS